MRRFYINIEENYVNVLISEFEYMRRSQIYASILGLLDISGQQTTGDLMLASKKSAEDSFSIANSSRFICQRIFDCLQINILVKSSKKQQRLIDVLFKWNTGKKLLLLGVDGSRSLNEPLRAPRKRKIAIFANYHVECKIIKQGSVKSIVMLLPRDPVT